MFFIVCWFYLHVFLSPCLCFFNYFYLILLYLFFNFGFIPGLFSPLCFSFFMCYYSCVPGVSAPLGSCLGAQAGLGPPPAVSRCGFRGCLRAVNLNTSRQISLWSQAFSPFCRKMSPVIPELPANYPQTWTRSGDAHRARTVELGREEPKAASEGTNKQTNKQTTKQ